MTAHAELAAWLRLTLIPGIGGETQRQLLKLCGDPAAIFAASAATLRNSLGGGLAERLVAHDCAAEIEAALAWAEQPGNRLLTLADAEYPRALLSAADPPVLLYVKGDVALLDRPAFAIVGSRNATKQGEANAEAFAAALAGAGLAIVSGLAAGIDAAAHRGALQAGGPTIAVIGTGIDRIYPARNEALAREIAAHGVILSEFALGTPPLPANFPRRNRLIAGLAQGCLVVEAARQSGSLITARLAAETGREVFAIPGSIHSPQAKGCHALIKQGAKLVESAQDILEELKWEAHVSPSERSAQIKSPAPGRGPGGGGPESSGEDAVLLAAIGYDPVDLDTLATRSGLAPDALLARLLPLELDGRVAQLPGGRYQRLN
jgi:DNA processing protein